MKAKSLGRSRLLATPWTAAYQAPLSVDFPGKSTGVGCHCLSLTSGQQSPGDSETCWIKSLVALVAVAVPGEPTRDIAPHCSLQPLLTGDGAHHPFSHTQG